jgi:triosephosphate isomerase
MSDQKSYVVANWKMNGSRAFCKDFFSKFSNLFSKIKAETLQNLELAMCPPFTLLETTYKHLAELQTKSSKLIHLGAQDLSPVSEGARTGEISASMILEQGCRYVLVGHSERRHLLGESNELIAAKFLAAKAAGLIPILCVGETKAERLADKTQAVVSEQLDAVLSQGAALFEGALIAYEPVWAIGTGLSASPEEAASVHRFLKQVVQCPVLYGGSVKAAQVAALLNEKEIDGVLVGGASLQAQEFTDIIERV